MEKNIKKTKKGYICTSCKKIIEEILFVESGTLYSKVYLNNNEITYEEKDFYRDDSESIYVCGECDGILFTGYNEKLLKNILKTNKI